MSVNKEAMQQWIDALRSGKYKQIFYRPFEPEMRACALGVAILESRDLSIQYSFAANLSHQFQRVYGISQADMNLVAQWNDDDGKDFFEIADLLYAKYLKEDPS